jgi:hypothetical protein
MFNPPIPGKFHSHRLAAADYRVATAESPCGLNLRCSWFTDAQRSDSLRQLKPPLVPWVVVQRLLDRIIAGRQTVAAMCGVPTRDPDTDPGQGYAG